jgi:hypothetical protein
MVTIVDGIITTHLHAAALDGRQRPCWPVIWRYLGSLMAPNQVLSLNDIITAGSMHAPGKHAPAMHALTRLWSDPATK